MTALANRGYYVKTSDSVLPLSYNEIPTNCSALATDANGNIIAGSGGSGGSTTGLAGGDLTGYYPDPLVKELSGLGVSWGQLKAKYTNGNPFIPGWGVLSLSFKTSGGLGLLISEYGTLYVTKDGGLTWISAGYSISATNTTRDIEYGKVTSSNNGWAAIGNDKVYYFEDIEANYDSNGIPLESAWVSGSINLTGADIAYSSSANSWILAEQAPGITYCQYLSTGTITTNKVTPTGASDNVGGIFIESNTNRLVYFERGTGRVWWAEPTSFTNASDWTEVLHGTTPILKSIYTTMTDGDGVGAGVSMNGTSAFAGQVVICTTNISDESSYMMAFDRGTLPSLWNITTDGVNWFGTTANAVDPCIYQLWIGSIPSHRQFVAEKGAVVYGNLILPEIQNAKVLGTDNNGKIIKIDKKDRLIDGIAEIFLDTTDSEVVAYNIIFTLATPVEFKKGEILTIEVFGELAEINTNLISTGAKVGYGTNSVSYGAIDITHKDIVLFLADSSNGKGITIKSRQAMTVFDDQIDVNGISTSLGNMKWEIAYTDDTLPNEYSVIDSTNNLVVATTSNNKAKLIPYGVNSKAKSIGVFNNTKITDKFDRISIGIFTGFAKMDQFASCSSWTGLSLNTTPVKARIKVE